MSFELRQRITFQRYVPLKIHLFNKCFKKENKLGNHS